MSVWVALRRESLGMWPRSRQRAGALAVAVAILTAFGIVVLSGDDASRLGPVLYVSLVGLALVFPAAVALQVIAGQILVWSIISGTSGVAALTWGLPLLVAVIVTAELLAIVTRLDTPLVPHSDRSLGEVGNAAIRGGAVFAVVLLVATLPGPGGLVAVVLAAAACAALANLLLRTSR